MSQTTAREAGLLRALGVWGLAASIVNVTIGGGIFRLPGVVSGSLGSAAPLAYLVCAVAMGLIVLCFAEAGSRVSMTGGPYAYVELAFGPFVGFLAGVLLWVLGTLAMSAVVTILADSVAGLVPALGGAGPRAAMLVGIFLVLSLVNIRGVEQGTRLNSVITVAKLLPLVLLVAVGAFAVDAERLVVEQAPAAADLARTSILLIFAFTGIESALVPSGEVKEPARTVPRAILLAMVTITVLYLGLQLVSQGVLGAELGSAQAPLAEAAGAVLGPWGRTLLLVGATVSMLGYVSGMTLAIPRALFAMGRDGFLPRALGAIHPRYHTPHVAIATQSAIVCGLAISSGFERLAVLANLGALLLYFACCVAGWELRRRNVQAGGIPFRVPAAGAVQVAALGVIAWMLTSITPAEWGVMGLVMVAGSAAFLLTRGHRARLAAEPAL